MCEAVGHEVLELQRLSMGPLTLDRLAQGSWRELTEKEVEGLRAACGFDE